jgi:hypothetical protein
MQLGREGINKTPRSRRRLKQIKLTLPASVRKERLIKLRNDAIIVRGREIQKLVSDPKFAHVIVRFDAHRRGWCVKAFLRRTFVRTPTALANWLTNLPAQVTRRKSDGGLL